KVKTLFTRRNVRTTEFSMTDAELDFYDGLTRYVEDQSIKAAQEDSARGRALGFTMAMLQRRFASSIYAVRRSLERMKEKREKILADPEGYREQQKLRRVPEAFDDLAGDGKAGRPLGKLREWGLSVCTIHGGMKVGDRDTPGSRICAEREFREDHQVLVATEAAGEGINLQFCWLMINFDIPWNPVRLEQRMGRIHRYGQEHDCLIFNFVAVNTFEGRVLDKLLERLAVIRKELGTDQVFDVVGEVL